MDIILTVITIVLFTGIILSLMYNVKYENTRLLYKLSASIYLTETMENIGIEDYDNVTSNNASLVPEDLPSFFEEIINVEDLSEDENSGIEEDIIKKITVSISYTVNGKKYEQSMERLKVK